MTYNINSKDNVKDEFSILNFLNDFINSWALSININSKCIIYCWCGIPESEVQNGSQKHLW